MIRPEGHALWQKSIRRGNLAFKFRILILKASGVFALVFLFVFSALHYQAFADIALAVSQMLNSERGGVTSYINKAAAPVAYASTDVINPTDTDDDGLSNSDEQIYGTDIANPDTDNDGYLDGDEVAHGYNPAGPGLLPSGDKDGDGMLNQAETGLGLDPTNRDTDGDGYTDAEEFSHGFDPANSSLGARPQPFLSYSSLGIVDVPVVDSVSTSEEDLNQALEHGAVRYPGSAFPGLVGNSFISGHSSDFAWKPGDYKDVFAPLLKANTGDTFTVAWRFSNGHSAVFTYQVKSKDIVDATDKRFFEKSDINRITLATCWPLGTSWKRLMLVATLNAKDGI